MRYCELVGVEAIFFFTHVVLLMLVETLFGSLFFKEGVVLLFIKGCLLFTKDAADETIRLFRVAVLLLISTMLKKL